MPHQPNLLRDNLHARFRIKSKHAAAGRWYANALTGEHHGANEIATQLSVLGADPVITNAS